MAFEKPGGLVWGGERQPTEVTFTGQTMRLAAASMAAGALGYGATRTLQSGYRPIDVFYSGSRVAGDLSPASFLNTFRTPEWLSPFASNKALGLSEGIFEWDLTSLSRGGAYTTQKYLEATTGLTSHELSRRGVSLQDGRNKALKLRFVREKDAVHGSLYAVTEAGEHLLNNRQMLMEANPAAVSATKRNLSKAAMAVMQSLNLTADPLFNPDLFGVRELGLNAEGVADLSQIPRFMPVPGVGVPGSWDEAKRMSSFLRAPSAFGMERPNELLKSTFEQVPLLGDVAKKLKTNLGFGLSVTPGPASHMFMRYGMLGMGAGAAVLGYQQLDYLHREGALEHVAAISASSAGIGYLAHRLGGGGLGARGALGVAAGAWAFQSLMPGFKEGITSGVISTYQTANIVRAAASPFNTQRRMMEGLFPGISSASTGVLLGGGLLAASYFAMPIVGRIPQKLLDDSRFGHKWLGIESSVQIGGGKVTPFVPKSVREIFWDEVEQHVSTLKGYSHTSQTTFNKVGMGKAKLLWTLGKDTGLNMGNNIELAGKLRKIWGDAVHQVDESSSKNPMNFSLESKLRKIDAKYGKDFSPVAKVSRFAEGWLESTKHAFFGADPLEKEFVERVSKIGFSPKMGRAALLFGAAMLFQQVATGGFLGSMETVKELQGQYEGRNLVEIKRGRWWEGGSNPIGGEQSGSYFRPHASYLMKNRVREKGIWGEEADTKSPITRFFLGNFTYHLEEKNYYDRPYPISGAAFENVPIIGRLLGATIGRLIKPATIMHADEWMREGANGLEYSDNYQGWKREPAYNLGAKPTGLPYHKLGSEKLFGQTIDTFRQLEGFTGWLKNTVQDQITGSSTFFGQEPSLASSAEITSPVRAFWDMNMGGALFSNELVRRFLSKDYGSGKKLNPITNSMPTWMPVKLRHGDPYCVSLDTQIETEGRRLLPAAQVEEGMLIRTHLGALAPVTKVLRRELGDSEKIFRLQFATLPAFVAKVSEDHPLWTSKGWTRAEDLTTADFVGYPIPSYDEQFTTESIVDIAAYCPEFIATDSWIYSSRASKEYVEAYEFLETHPDVRFPRGELKIFLESKGWSRKIYENAQYSIKSGEPTRDIRVPRYLNIDTSDWGIVAGYFLAEGSTSQTAISIVLNKHEDTFLEEYNAAFERLFGLVPRVYDYETWKTANINNRVLALFFRRYIGAHTRAKDIQLTDNNWVHFIRCLFNGDGCFFFDKNNGKFKAELKQENVGLLYYIRQILLAKGIVSSINFNTLSMKGTQAFAFARLVSFDKAAEFLAPENDYHVTESSYWYLHEENNRKYIYLKVRSVDLCTPETVVGFQVDGDQSFCIAGVATHNTSIEWGEARLPGAGFVALHPELKGVDPQDYPLVYQYSILADVAPFSPELEMTRRTLYAQRQKGLTSENENQYMDYIGNLLNEKTKGVDSNRVAPNAIEIPLLSNVTQRATFGIKSMIQELAAPAEYLIPMGFRPTHKLMGDRSPIQEYEYQRLYGSQTAFWDKPWRDWLRPSMYSAMHVLGYEGKPAFRQEANEVNQQFDKVDFYKWMKLAEDSEAAGNVGMATRYRYMANNTRTGVNPQGTPMGIYWSLPAEDRPFFNAFANAQGAERTRIMEMVPEDQVGLYQAVWNRVDQEDPGMWAGSTTRVSDQYLAGKFSELKSDTNFMQSLPQEDWIGFNQDVDMQDIKAKYVDHMGRDLHDFGLWERQLSSAESQPYLDGSEGPMVESVSTVRNRMTSNLTRLMRGAFQGPSIVVNSRPSIMGGVDAQLTLNDDRYMETRMKLRGWNE